MNFGENPEIHNSPFGNFCENPEISDSDPGSIETLLATGLSASDVAQRFDISLQLATAIDFERRTLDDAERCHALGMTTNQSAKVTL